jgi:threonine dehydratase
MKTRPVKLEDIEAANRRLQGAIVRSPLEEFPELSAMIGARIYCKREDLQVTGSFKERGARNALSRLSHETRNRGVVAASAGNHGQGVAFHGALLGAPVDVVVPFGAPEVKISSCARFGANVIQHGTNFDESGEFARNYAKARGITFLHPFDDPYVIAGQGTVGLEILGHAPKLDVILVPIGGGGLIAGVSTVLKRLRPGIRVIGVEPEEAQSMLASRKAGVPTGVKVGRTLADGLAVSRIGKNAFASASRYVDDLVVVSEESIAQAIAAFYLLAGLKVEGAGAVGLAALLEGKIGTVEGKRIGLLLTGRNIDETVHSRVIAPFGLGKVENYGKYEKYHTCGCLHGSC